MAASLFILQAFNQHIVFFFTPSQLDGQSLEPKQRIRLGGLVEGGSVVQEGKDLHFSVTDNAASLPVEYEGLPPALFREGQGVVAEGYVNENGIFHAERLLAKHDENYMPPELAKAIKATGQWKEDTAP